MFAGLEHELQHMSLQIHGTAGRIQPPALGRLSLRLLCVRTFLGVLTSPCRLVFCALSPPTKHVLSGKRHQKVTSAHSDS